MAAKNQGELLHITHKEFSKLEILIESVSSVQALRKDDEATSIKDVIAHRAHWIALFLGWYSDGLSGKTVYFPAKGYKWNDLKRYNSELRKKQQDLDWSQAWALLKDNYGQLVNFIESKSDDELYAGPMPGAKSHWTTGRWAEAAGASHFRSASKYIRARLKAMQ